LLKWRSLGLYRIVLHMCGWHPLQALAQSDLVHGSAHTKKTSMHLAEPFESNPKLLDTAEIPIRVREAATFLGVSPQTVYLWVERKQIPHLRVMGRNIRFLRSELEPFRAQFKQEIGNG